MLAKWVVVLAGDLAGVGAGVVFSELCGELAFDVGSWKSRDRP
jgi:hypothetical protein